MPTSISSQGGPSSAQGSQPSPVGMPISNNGSSAQAQSSHHHQQNPFQGRGYSSFNSSVVGQGGPVIVPNP